MSAMSIDATGVTEAMRSTLVETIRGHARRRGSDVALVFISGAAERTVTYRAVDAGACAFAEQLTQASLGGGHVLLPMTSDLQSVVTLLGCLYAGVACAPVQVPTGQAGARRLGALAASSNCAALLAASKDLPRLAAVNAKLVVVGDERAGSGDRFAPPDVSRDRLALVQYTSGSGSDPKGVMLTHANISANLEMLRRSFGVRPEDRFASWLPLFHDMGLAMLLMPLYFGCRGVLMPPMTFIRDPARWFDVIDADGATITGAPNFAYDLSARRVSAATIRRLDLSRLRLAFNGAEPVRGTTMRVFAERFAEAGFRPSAFFPCYGLAEAVTFVSGGHLDEDDLGASTEDATVPSRPMHSGRPAAGTTVAIADDRLRPLPDGTVGEICVAGPHVGSGYLDQPAITEQTFGLNLKGYEGLHFLRTGDLGFVQAGRLTITGRLKDVIVHRGVNLHAVDAENVVSSSHSALGEAAAFAIERDGSEALLVVQEIARGMTVDDPSYVLRVAEEAIVLHLGVRPADIVLVRAGAIPRTTSGKVRRNDCRRLYEGCLLEVLHALQERREPRPPIC